MSEKKLSPEAVQCTIQARQNLAWGRTPEGAVWQALTDVFPKTKVDVLKKMFAVVEEQGEITDEAFQSAMDAARG